MKIHVSALDPTMLDELEPSLFPPGPFRNFVFKDIKTKRTVNNIRINAYVYQFVQGRPHFPTRLTVNWRFCNLRNVNKIKSDMSNPKSNNILSYIVNVILSRNENTNMSKQFEKIKNRFKRKYESKLISTTKFDPSKFFFISQPSVQEFCWNLEQEIPLELPNLEVWHCGSDEREWRWKERSKRRRGKERLLVMGWAHRPARRGCLTKILKFVHGCP